MPYVQPPLAGGACWTNYRTVKQSIKRLKDLETPDRGGRSRPGQQEGGPVPSAGAGEARARGWAGSRDMGPAFPDVAVSSWMSGTRRLRFAEAMDARDSGRGCRRYEQSPPTASTTSFPANDDAIRSIELYVQGAATRHPRGAAKRPGSRLRNRSAPAPTESPPARPAASRRKKTGDEEEGRTDRAACRLDRGRRRRELRELRRQPKRPKTAEAAGSSEAAASVAAAGVGRAGRSRANLLKTARTGRFGRTSRFGRNQPSRRGPSRIGRAGPKRPAPTRGAGDEKSGGRD